MRQTFLHLRDKISLFTFLFLLAALSGGCCSRNRLMEGFHRDNYIVFEPISVSYMKYVLDLQDLNGIIAGVEKRSPDLSSNSALKDYLARLKTLNDNYNKTTPPVFADQEDWKMFCTLAKNKNNKPYFYIKQELGKTAKDIPAKTISIRTTGLLILDSSGRIIKDHIVEKRTEPHFQTDASAL